MPSRTPSRPQAESQALSPETLVTTALALLQSRARGASLPQWLHGRQLALMSTDATAAAAVLFRSAAIELGARVSLVKPTLGVHSAEIDVERIARLLGSLYDAVECQGVAAALVQRLAQAAGIPVFDALAGTEHATAALCSRLPADACEQDKRRALVQAALAFSLR